MMSENPKSIFRKTLQSLRRAIPLSKRNQAAEKAATLFAKMPLFQASQHIGCYYPMPDEFDCLPLIQTIWKAGKKCYLPSLIEDEKKLHFMAYHEKDVLQLNRYRIYESMNQEKIPSTQLDIVLVPLVGFDLAGHRLGMGVGYYDRTFAHLRASTEKKCYLFGLAYAMQCVDRIPYDTWDISLDGVITEEDILYFASFYQNKIR